MKLVRLIKTVKTYTTIPKGKYLSVKLPVPKGLKQGDALHYDRCF